MPVAVFNDGNWLLHRAQSVAGKFSAVPEKRIPILVLTWFCSYAIKLNATHGALCFDGAFNFRHELYSGYKNSRAKDSKAERAESGASKSDNTYAALQPCLSLFALAGLPTYQHAHLESDDLMAAGAFSFTRDNEKQYRPGYKAYMICNDKDLLQSVDRQVEMFTPEMTGQKERRFTVAEVVKVRGMKPKQFADYQTLIGDSIDDIPGICSPKFAANVIKVHGSLKRYFATEEGGLFFRKHGNEIIRNRRLITMAKLAWKPTLEELVLAPKSENDHIIVEQFGSLPASLTALRAILSPNKKGLF